jgi:hypothetical protein
MKNVLEEVWVYQRINTVRTVLRKYEVEMWPLFDDVGYVHMVIRWSATWHRWLKPGRWI